MKDEVLDLQPDFQRQEVWSDAKKKRLVDSILREWHVPPVHVVVEETGRENVLDGQQRLAAIRDFVANKFSIDGRIPPDDSALRVLDGMRYQDLPPATRRKFDRFTIRYYRIEDYSPEEPGELFFRLNQPTNLTTAEKRNAFYGPARHAVKSLVETMGDLGLDDEVLGFSNARMAHDDVVARVCFTIESGTLERKVTAQDIADIYRSTSGFARQTVERTARGIRLLAGTERANALAAKFNKATLYSWLVFLADFDPVTPTSLSDAELGHYISGFEHRRRSIDPPPGALLEVFNDRSSSRVADVASVMARDFIIWFDFVSHLLHQGRTLGEEHPRVSKLLLLAPRELASRDAAEQWVAESMQYVSWGAIR
jgi:hypothetical protein